MTDAERVTTESLKLLLQVVFGDTSAGPREADFMLRLAREAGATADFEQRLPDFLAGRAPLPPPDLGLLRRYRDGVLAMARLLARADGTVCDDEQRLVEEIDALLGAS